MLLPSAGYAGRAGRGATAPSFGFMLEKMALEERHLTRDGPLMVFEERGVVPAGEGRDLSSWRALGRQGGEVGRRGKVTLAGEHDTTGPDR